MPASPAMLQRVLQVKSLLYGIAVNAYCVAYVPAGSTLPEIFSSWDQASDAQVSSTVQFE